MSRSKAPAPVSPLALSRAGTRARAWDVTDRAASLASRGEDIIHLGVGDPDLDTPAAIVDAAIAAIERRRTHYAPLAGEPDLCTAIATHAKKHWRVSVRTDEVCVFPGAQNALFAVMNCVAGPGDEVLVPEPFYATYEGTVSSSGASMRALPCAADRGFLPDIQQIAANIRPNTRALLVNSPCNPTGAVFDRNTWAGIESILQEHCLWLVSDEVYASYCYEDRHRTALSLESVRDWVVVVNSLSKSHAMTGWRLGWSIAPQELTGHLVNLSQCMNFGVSQFVQDAAVVALRDCDDASAKFASEFQRRRDCLYDRLAAVDALRMSRPAGGMFVMVDVSATGMDGDAFANRLLDEAGVSVVPGFAFGDSATQFVRIGFLQDTQTLERAADRIESFVAGL